MVFVPPNCYYFFIGKAYSIGDYKLRNVFNVHDHLLTKINYTAIQTQKPKGQ